MSRRKKRFWSDEETWEICAQAATPGMSVAQVARRYAVDANLVFKWLKAPRFAPEVEGLEREATFLPIEIAADVALSDGRRILVEGPPPLAAVISLVKGLTV